MLESLLAAHPFVKPALLADAVLLVAIVGLRRLRRGAQADRLRREAFRDERVSGPDSRFARERQAWVEAEAQLKQVLAAQGQGRAPTHPPA